MNRPCIVCGSAQGSPFYPGIIKCNLCDFVFADLDLSPEELSRIYGEDYFFGKEYSDYLADKKALEKNFKLRLKVLNRFRDPLRHKRLFEIGCAYGFFLSAAKDHFERVQGIDLTPHGVRYSRDQLGLNVIQGDLLEIELKDKFDVVCLWDTIEHLTKPDLYLQKISRHMDSGALLALTTGDIESLNARWKKEKWRLIHPPTHLHYFSKQTLARLLDRYGFEVIYSRYCGFYRSVEFASYNVFVLRRQWPAVHQWINRMGLGRLSFYFNLYDIMYVIARKR